MTTRSDTERGGFHGLTATEDEFVTLADDGHKYELVDDKVVEVPTWWEHGFIVMRIAALMSAIAQEYGALADSSTGFRMTSGNIRSPDLSFVRRERIPTGSDARRFFDGAPDLAIEVISESEDRQDMARKVVEYLDSGAHQVWQVFPHTRRLVIYHSLDRIRSYEAADEIGGDDVLPGFRALVGDFLPSE